MLIVAVIAGCGRSKEKMDFNILNAQPLSIKEIEAIERPLSWAEVKQRFGKGMPTEGPVVWYPAKESDIDCYWFWFAPGTSDKNQGKPDWSFENTRLLIVSAGGDGKIVWPSKDKGKAIHQFWKEFNSE